MSESSIQMSVSEDASNILKKSESVNIEEIVEPEIKHEEGGTTSTGKTIPLSNLQKNKFRTILGLEKHNVTFTNEKLEDQDESEIHKNRAIDKLFDERAKDMKVFFWVLTIENCYF